MLRRLSNANLKLNWTKCQIRQSHVKYLGHWLSDQGILPDADKMHAIQDMPYPESVTDVRRFMGMATYLGKFIPHLSKITESLRQLAKREPFVVDQELQEAFSDAKKGITSALQKLSYFQSDSSVQTAISSDASPRNKTAEVDGLRWLALAVHSQRWRLATRSWSARCWGSSSLSPGFDSMYWEDQFRCGPITNRSSTLFRNLSTMFHHDFKDGWCL